MSYVIWSRGTEWGSDGMIMVVSASPLDVAEQVAKECGMEECPPYDWDDIKDLAGMAEEQKEDLAGQVKNGLRNNWITERQAARIMEALKV